MATVRTVYPYTVHVRMVWMKMKRFSDKAIVLHLTEPCYEGIDELGLMVVYNTRLCLFELEAMPMWEHLEEQARKRGPFNIIVFPGCKSSGTYYYPPMCGLNLTSFTSDYYLKHQAVMMTLPDYTPHGMRGCPECPTSGIYNAEEDRYEIARGWRETSVICLGFYGKLYEQDEEYVDVVN